MNALLLSALIQVESGGNDYARGKHGELGPLQITPRVVIDVNRISHAHFEWRRMTNRVEAAKVATIYLDHYAHDLDDLSRARVWNGGPRGHLKPSTRPYARRIRKELDRQLVTINKTNRR